MYFEKSRPSTAAGIKATIRLRYKATSILKNRARYSQTTASIAPVWITRLNTVERSSVAPIRSAARIRWPVLEIGRNSVRPSTTPRISALRRSLIQECVDAPPEVGMCVDVVVVGAFEGDPALRARPGVVEKLGMFRRDDAIAHCDHAQQRRRNLRRAGKRIEAMLEEPADGQVRIVAPADRHQAVERRDEDRRIDLALGGKAHRDAAAEAAAENVDLLRLRSELVVPEQRIGGQCLFRRRAFARAVAAIVDEEPRSVRHDARHAEHPGNLFRIAAEIENERRIRRPGKMPGVQPSAVRGLREHILTFG